MVLCKLIQSSLGRWVCLAAMCRPQKLWSEGGTLSGATMTELDDVRDWEKADHVNEQLESKTWGQQGQELLSDIVYNLYI